VNGAYSAAFREELRDLMQWRRDVRRFRTDPVEAAVLDRCLDAFRLAPSVGLSEPWRLIRVDSADIRLAVVANFELANATALKGFSDEKAAIYASLKLAGLREAPIHLAVFCDEACVQGSGLGVATMPEMLAYSVSGAISMFWLAARAEGLGVGWVSILDPALLSRDLDVPAEWRLVAYLCIGWPETTGTEPELERAGWERRSADLKIERR
jgi:5,6-dimethylbenzimidazole synthase